MNFVKKHYEKILLCGVLVGLFAALLYLPIAIGQDKANLQQIVVGIIKKKAKPMEPLDMSQQNGMLDRVSSSYELDFETTNRLFNPMPWQKASDGHLIEIRNGNEVGPEAVEIVKIIPLYYILRLDSIEPANQFSAARYVVSIENQDAPIAPQRRPRKHWLSVGEKDAELSLMSATGPADSPQLTVQLVASGEQVVLSKTKSYRDVTSYAADLTYPPQNKHWYDQRVGAVLNLNGSDYKVVVIDANEVVLSAQANQKKTTRKYQP